MRNKMTKMTTRKKKTKKTLISIVGVGSVRHIELHWKLIHRDIE